MARSLNKVQLIGNLTRDPELKYTPKGTAVCIIGLATNRSWTTDTGEKKDEADFHRIVAWNKLAEICAQLLSKGRKVYVEGRLQTRSWEGQDGVKRQTTEVIISDMLALDPKGSGASGGGDFNIPDDLDSVDFSEEKKESKDKKKDSPTKTKEKAKDKKSEEEDDDIPF